MQPLVSSLSTGDRLVQPLRKEPFLSGCTRRSPVESDDTRGCISTICVVDLLMMGGLCSNMERSLILCKLCEWTRNYCIKLVIIKSYTMMHSQPNIKMIHLFAASFIFHILTVWNHLLCLLFKQKFTAVKNDLVLLNFFKKCQQHALWLLKSISCYHPTCFSPFSRVCITVTYKLFNINCSQNYICYIV